MKRGFELDKEEKKRRFLVVLFDNHEMFPYTHEGKASLYNSSVFITHLFVLLPSKKCEKIWMTPKSKTKLP